MDEVDAEELVKELIKALPNLINTEDSFGELVNKVKSPKGTTEAGLDSLNDDSFDTIIFNAIQKSTNRSIEISAELKNE
jgi:pyrroline-5-carboxylate reductase